MLTKNTQLTLTTICKLPPLDLDVLFQAQGKFFRTVFNAMYWNKADRELYKQFCSIQYLYEQGYCFGTKYASSLFLDAKTKAKLHQEELAFRLKEIAEKKAKKLKEKVKLENKLKLYQKIYHNKEDYLKTKTLLYWLNRKLEKLDKLAKNLPNSGVTFGSKKYQRKLSLKQTTKEAWQRKRNNFIYAAGRTERKTGNDSFKLTQENQQYQLEIELDRKLTFDENKGKIIATEKNYIVVPIKFNYLEQDLRQVHKKTYRIVRRKKLELHTSFEKVRIEQIVENPKVLGVDFNSGHLDYYLNDKVCGTVPFNIERKLKAKQRRANLREAIKQICVIAELQQVKQINIEHLNFNRKKNQLNKGNKQYNEMLSNLPYSQYEKLFTIELFKRNSSMVLKKVNPAYTSRTALAQGLDRHIGAAKIIATK